MNGAKNTADGRRLKRVMLDFTWHPGADVFVAGTFNEWDPRARRMKQADGKGHYRAVLRLPPGHYEYKLVVDGEWRIDQGNPRWALNGLGSLNSVLDVG